MLATQDRTALAQAGQQRVEEAFSEAARARACAPPAHAALA
ncbi:MAG: hypothetical protein R3F59_33070 [Myxococcota bacterium]